MPVGMPGFTKSRMPRLMPVNELDKCTVVSIYPRSFVAVKPTTVPSRYEVPAGTFDNPGVLVVGGSFWLKDVDPEQELIQIPHSSLQVAEAIVNDFVVGLVGFEKNTRPGLFWVQGDLTAEEVRTKHQNLLIRYRDMQVRFFQSLIKLADGFWSRTNGNPLSISEDMKMAARELGISKSKPWMNDAVAFNMVPCAACGALKDPKYPVCQVCKAIDKEAATEKGIEFAS